LTSKIIKVKRIRYYETEEYNIHQEREQETNPRCKEDEEKWWRNKLNWSVERREMEA